MSKYNINGLPWASGIGKDVSDCHTSQEVMEKAGLNFFVDKCESLILLFCFIYDCWFAVLLF